MGSFLWTMWQLTLILLSLVTHGSSSWFTNIQNLSSADVRIQGRMIETPGMEDHSCHGTVKLFNDDAEPIFEASNSVTVTNELVNRVVVDGNCCWILYQKKRFRGPSVVATEGVRGISLSKVKSIKKLNDC